MPESAPVLRATHREEVERLLERAVAEEARQGRRVDAKLLLQRAQGALDEIAGAAAEEYVAYVGALDAGQAVRPRALTPPPALLVGVTAVTALGADLALGTSAAAAVGAGAAVAVAGFAANAAGTALARGLGRSGGAAPEQLRTAWLTAVERRGVRPFLEQNKAFAPPPAKGAVPHQAQPAKPRRTDRSAAARQRAVLEASFTHLPAVEGPFAGRKQHIAQIAQWVHQARVSPATESVVVVLHGPPGSGRSVLAVTAARQLRDQFRGACVVDLRGAAADEPPLPLRHALLHLLNQLGAPREQLLFRERPSQEQHLRRLGELYQKHLTGTPVVIVLDDAADATQVQALVPERSDSLVLVTARAPLELDLPQARVHSLAVGPLERADAYDLLRELAATAGVPGPDQVESDRLRELSGGLPLALRLVGSAVPDHRTPGQLAADLFAYGKPAPGSPVDPALALRYHDQAEPARRLLRRLALAGRASLGAAAAATLLGTDEPDAARRLHDLARAGLIEHVRGSRYRLHDLVRAFAQARLLEEEAPAERAAAQERLIRNYAELAESVIRLLDGMASTRAGRFGPHGFPSLDLALRWLDDESSFITSTLRHAEGVDRTAVRDLLGALCDYCLLRGDLYRLGEINELAQSLRSGDGTSDGQAGDEGLLVRSVQWRTGIAARQLGELDQARSTLSSVVNLYVEAQHPAGAARALTSLGITLQQQGNLREAEQKLREALEIQTAEQLTGDRGWSQHALAAVLRDAGKIPEALALLQESLVVHREHESVHGEAWAHLQLGQLYLRVGSVELGERELHRAEECCALAQDNRGQAWARTQLARARLLRGDAQGAAQELNEALLRHRENEDARGEAWSLYYLGHALEEGGEPDPALRALERARTMFSRMRDVYGLACARHHSARVTRDQRAARTGNLRNSGFARQLLQDARQDFRRIGVPHGEAWSCLELAVIDAGNGRLSEALVLTEDAERLFSGIGDLRGRDWACFLQCTLLPLVSRDGTAEALGRLGDFFLTAHEGRDADVQEYAEAYELILQRGVAPGDPWDAWRLGMVPSRGARMVMAMEAIRPG